MVLVEQLTKINLRINKAYKKSMMEVEKAYLLRKQFKIKKNINKDIKLDNSNI